MTLYEINVAIDALHRELKVVAEADPSRTDPRGFEIVAEIRELEDQYRVLRAATPRDYSGL